MKKIIKNFISFICILTLVFLSNSSYSYVIVENNDKLAPSSAIKKTLQSFSKNSTPSTLNDTWFKILLKIAEQSGENAALAYSDLINLVNCEIVTNNFEKWYPILFKIAEQSGEYSTDAYSQLKILIEQETVAQNIKKWYPILLEIANNSGNKVRFVYFKLKILIEQETVAQNIKKWYPILLEIAKKSGQDTTFAYSQLTKLIEQETVAQNIKKWYPILLEIAKANENAGNVYLELISLVKSKIISNNFKKLHPILLEIAKKSSKNNTYFILTNLIKCKIIADNLENWYPIFLEIAEKSGENTPYAYFELISLVENKIIADNLENWYPIFLEIAEKSGENTQYAYFAFKSLIESKILTETNFEEREYKLVTLLIKFAQNLTASRISTFLVNLLKNMPEKFAIIIQIFNFIVTTKNQKFDLDILQKAIDNKIFLETPIFSPFKNIIFAEFSCSKKGQKKKEWKKRIRLAKQISYVVNMYPFFKKNEKLKSNIKNQLQAIENTFNTTKKTKIVEPYFKNIYKLYLAIILYPVSPTLKKISSDSKIMTELLALTSRLSNIWLKPENKLCKEKTIEILKIFFSETGNIANRKTKIQKYINTLSSNQKEIKTLIKQGYSESIWKQDFSLTSIVQGYLKTKKMTIILTSDFFKICSSSDAGILGCYAPNGEYSQKPIEDAIMANSTIISVHDKNGKEIENAEAVFTEKGMYVYKIYSNGHGIDTEILWAAFYQKLLHEKIVPAVLLSKTSAGRNYNYQSVVMVQEKQIIYFYPVIFCDSYYDNDSIITPDIILTNTNFKEKINLKIFNPQKKGAKSSLRTATKLMMELITDIFSIKISFLGKIINDLLNSPSQKNKFFETFDLKKTKITLGTWTNIQNFILHIISIAKIKDKRILEEFDINRLANILQST